MSERKATILSKSLEAQIFSNSYSSESKYDKLYDNIVRALDIASKQQNVLSVLLENFFDFDKILEISKSNSKAKSKTNQPEDPNTKAT